MKTPSNRRIEQSSLNGQPRQSALGNKQLSSSQLSDSWNPSRRIVRCLLKTQNGWLADHTYVDDETCLTTNDPWQALQFVTAEAAANRATLIFDLFPDLKVEFVEMPSPVIYGRQRISRKDG